MTAKRKSQIPRTRLNPQHTSRINSAEVVAAVRLRKPGVARAFVCREG
jgi:hypothetical protein